MKKHCIVCNSVTTVKQPNQLAVCLVCQQLFLSIELGAGALPIKNAPAVSSLYYYDEPLRPLVLRAKVQSDHQALFFLESLFVGNPRVLALGNWCELIISAPSSLWGRIRGRFDLAYFLARSLATVVGKPLASAPSYLHWRLKKRAQMQDRSRSDTEKSRLDSNSFAASSAIFSGSQKILLIDDVVTTGHTLSESALALTGDTGEMFKNIKCLTLARKK
jgi:predicted amidophosphoribosyltransferase